MPRKVIVGTAGHIDHGKSALVRALTGIDPDRLKEEKERGITIELGFAHLTLPSGTVAGVVDVPGHEKFVRAMVAGAAGIDIVMLVVAADEGIKPQTREHMDICRLLSVRHGLVALNKCDAADPEWIDLQEEEIRGFVRGTFLEGAPIVRVSALTGEGLPGLVAELDRIASGIPGKDPSHLFRLPVDRSFIMKGFGTVVTGTIVGGTVRVGEEVRVLPRGPVARIRGLQVHGGAANVSSAGTRTAVNLQGVEKESAPRGSVLCHTDAVAPTRAAEVFLEYLPLAPKPLRNRAQATFHAGTSSCLCKLLLYGAPEIPPGGSGYAKILLAEETVLLGGDRFILRGFSPLENFGYTVGGGQVLHPWPPARKGAGKAVPTALPSLRSADPPERMNAAIEDAGVNGIQDKEIAGIAGVGLDAARSEISRRVASGELRQEPGGARYFHASAVALARVEATAALAALHARFPDREGFPREEIAAYLKSALDIPLIAMSLSGGQDVGCAGDLHFLPEKRPRSVELSSPLARSIAEAARGAGLSALSVTELLDLLKPRDKKEFDKTLDGLAKSGAVVRVKELVFDAGAVGALKEKLVSHLGKRGEITVPEFKEMTGLTRKYIIPLLEHFDTIRLTLRVGDKRVLRKGK